jgi:hypothetical protein
VLGTAKLMRKGTLKEVENKRTSMDGPEDIYPDYTTIPSHFRYSSGSHSKEVARSERTLCKDWLDLDTLLKRPHKAVAGQTVKKKLGPA